jgi:hypothetical protein
VTDDAGAVTAVVLGGGVTGLAVLRELGRAGVPVLGTADGDDLAAASRYFRPLPAAVPAQDDDGIEAYFRSLELERAVLFPCSDSWARAASGSPLSSSSASRPSRPRPDWSSSLRTRPHSWISSSARQSRTRAQWLLPMPGTWRRSPTLS